MVQMRKDETNKAPDRVSIKLGPSKYDSPKALDRALKNAQQDAVTNTINDLGGSFGGAAGAKIGLIITIDTSNSTGTAQLNTGELVNFVDATSRSLQAGWEVVIVQDELTGIYLIVGVSGNASYLAPGYTAPTNAQNYPVDGLLPTYKLRATVYDVLPGLAPTSIVGGTVGVQWAIDEAGALGFGVGAIVGSTGANSNTTGHHPRTVIFNPFTGASSQLAANTLSTYAFVPAKSIYFVLGSNLFEYFYSLTTNQTEGATDGSLFMWDSSTGVWSLITSGNLGGIDSGYIWLLADGPSSGTVRAYVRAVDGTGTVTQWQPTNINRFARGMKVSNGAVWTKTSTAATGGSIVIARGTATLSGTQTATGQTGNVQFFTSDVDTNGNLWRLVHDGTAYGFEVIDYSTAVLTSLPDVWSTSGVQTSGEPWFVESMRFTNGVLTVAGSVDDSVVDPLGTPGYAVPAIWQTDGTTTVIIHFDNATNSAADACAGSLTPLASGGEAIWIDAGTTSSGSAPTNYTYQMSWIYRAVVA